MATVRIAPGKSIGLKVASSLSSLGAAARTQMPGKSKRSADLSFRSAAFHARQQPCAVIVSRFAPLRIALSGAKGLTVNSAKDLALGLEAPFVILSPSLVILSAAKDPFHLTQNKLREESLQPCTVILTVTEESQYLTEEMPRPFVQRTDSG